MRSDTDMLIRKLDSTFELADDDRQLLAEMPVRVIQLEADKDIVRDGETPRECCLLIAGFIQRSAITPDGRRQIFAFHTPGDVPDLQSLRLREMDHNIGTLMPCTVGLIAHETLRGVMRKSQRIADAIWREPLIDAAISRAWITGLGQRSAHGHLAHLFCEVFTRSWAVGMTSDHTCSMPVTQAELGEALGLSTVHVNRTLMELRGKGLVEFQSGRLTILNWKGLAAAAQFNPRYLHLRKKFCAA